MQICDIEIGLPVLISTEYTDHPKLVGYKAKILYQEGDMYLLGLECDSVFAKEHKLHSGFDLVPNKFLGLYKGYCVWAYHNEFNTLH